MDVIGDFEPMCPGRGWHDFFFFFWIFFMFLFFFFVFFLSLLLQCKLANSTLLSLLSFSYFITPYDAQASSAFSALIFTSVATIITISKIMIKECLQRNPIDDVKNYNGGGRNNPALVRRIIIG